ncbi:MULTISPECIES: pLS20_p028 family conjugation system transmembrane protein, partial [unclassified Exiguobacterium]|uniref:pLS20_p028 family conjugation system transmembrane protein n=1 Tax=unclassified Exiguobacterium TaxID=2644629 RepID=UPI001359DE68
MEITATLYETFGPYLDMTNLWSDHLRRELWKWVVALMQLLQGVESLYTGVDELFRGFFTNPLIGRLEGVFVLFFWAFMVIQGVILGYMMFVNPAMKYGNVFQAFFFAIVVVLIVPDVVSKGLDLSDSGQVFVEEAMGDGNSGAPLSEIVVRNNVYDVKRFIEDGWQTPPGEMSISEKNGLDSRQGIVLLNPFSRVTDEMMESALDEKILTQYWDSDQNEPVELDGGLFGIGEVRYYRYHIDFFPIFVQLVTLAFALVFVAFKTMMLLYEILLAQVLAPIAAAIGARESDTMRNIFSELAQKLLTLVILVLGFRLYLYFSNLLFASDQGGLAKLIGLFVLTIGLFKGITYFDNKFGTRAGLREGVDMARAGGSVFTAPLSAGIGAMTGAAAVKRSAETLKGKKNDALPVPLRIDYGDSKKDKTGSSADVTSTVASRSPLAKYAKNGWKADPPKGGATKSKPDASPASKDVQATPDGTEQSTPETGPTPRKRWKWQNPQPDEEKAVGQVTGESSVPGTQEESVPSEPAPNADARPHVRYGPQMSQSGEPARTGQAEPDPDSSTGSAETGEASPPPPQPWRWKRGMQANEQPKHPDTTVPPEARAAYDKTPSPPPLTEPTPRQTPPKPATPQRPERPKGEMRHDPTIPRTAGTVPAETHPRRAGETPEA